MKWFHFLKGKKNTEETKEQEEEKDSLDTLEENEETPVQKTFTFKKENVKLQNPKEREEYVIRCCEQMQEAAAEVENAKLEYNLVTDYLNDMQMVEDMAEPNRSKVHALATKIVNLERERSKREVAPRKITDMQYMFINSRAEELPDALRSMHKNERYMNILKADMQNLEQERSLNYHKRTQAYESLENIKSLSIISFVTLVIVFVMLFIAQYALELDVQYGYLLAMFAAVFMTGGLLIRSYQLKRELIYTEKALNKVVSLLNIRKIKYVNIKNALDYLYDKYQVKNYHALNYMWEQYLIEYEERAKRKNDEDDLLFYSEQLVDDLRELGIKDALIWPQQARAILDPKEMVEIRHRLIGRRQIIRNLMDENAKVQQDISDEILELTKSNGEYTKEILDIVNNFMAENRFESV